MSHKSALQHLLDLPDPSDGSWDSSALFLPPQSQGRTPTNSSPPTPVVLPAETAEAQAAVSSSGSGSPGSIVAETSGGLTINLIFDAAAMAAPASFRAGIEQAAAMLSAAISDKITLNFQIDCSGTGGGAAAGPDGGEWVNYSTVRADLANNASPGDTTFNALPAGSTIQGQSSVAVWNPQLKLWGLLGANDTTTDDGSATFATDINPSLLVGVALHELTHAMGRVPYGPEPDVFDFYRFTSPGVRLFSDNIPASAAYFSLNGGSTKLADYGQNSDPSDFLNSGVQGGNDPFNEYYSAGTLQQLTAVDLKQLDALGYNLTSATPVVIQTDGTTSLVQVGSNYFLDPAGGGTGPGLDFNGAPVTVGMWAGWAPIGAVQTAGGYEVAWKDASTGSFDIWSTDSNGNYLTILLSPTSGTSAALENFETTFHQDLNGDGTIGPITTVIQTDGTTSLVQVGSNYFLDPAGGGTGPGLDFNGAPVTVGMWAGWAPIGAVQTAGGYEVAWKDASTGSFDIWSTDSNGNYLTILLSPTSGTSAALENFETTFHQDLNGDGTIGPITTVIQTDGTTSLVQVGSNYFLDPAGGGTGSGLDFNGAPVTVGMWAGWAPIGAVQTAGGYEVAWKDASTGSFDIWSTDSNGNYLTILLSPTSGTSAALENFETTFHQDLNGDGTIGPITTVIQTDGTTSLVQVGSNYFLDPTGGGTGSGLDFNGAPVTVGMWAGWAPIGAVQTAGGYEVAWKDASTGSFDIWSTDSNGNYLTILLSPTSGTSAALENFETTFHQDLNGDGTIGVPSPTSPTAAQSAGAQPELTMLDGKTLTLETPSAFNGQIVGFTGDGTLAASDQIDLRGFNFNSIHSNFDSSSGVLSLNDGSTAASLQFLGLYSQDSFHFADDGNGGTLVIAATPPNQTGGASQVSNSNAHDTFVFAPNFGKVTIANFAPATDTVEFKKSVFADMASLMAATHDDGSGNAVIIDAAHDTITFQHIAAAQLLMHQSDFHFV